jgi:putative ubiquitin-RnfH superfamily antitoxin RatB of RatAB toxin-antitoxin module
MVSAETHARLNVTVACSPAEGVVEEESLTLDAGAKVDDALRASGLLERHVALASLPAGVGVWGRPCDRDQPLLDGDRVEIYRALLIDPKEARRLRQQRQLRRP